MQSRVRILLVLLLVIAVPRPASASVHSLIATEDTWIEEFLPFANHAVDTELDIIENNGGDRRTLIKFDLSSVPPGSVILSAFLNLDVTNADVSGLPVEIYRVTMPWLAPLAVWANVGTAISAAPYGGFAPVTTGAISADVTSLVQEWVDGTSANDGLMLIATSFNDLSTVSSRNSLSPSNHPTLFVTTVEPVTGMRMTTGFYGGDGAPTQSVAGLGFTPDVVIVKGNNGQAAIVKTATMDATSSKPLVTTAPQFTGRIISLDVDGFTVGNPPGVNASGARYDWIAFEAAAGEMTVGSYTGNGVDGRVINGIGFQPGYVTVFNEQAFEAVHRFADQNPDESHTFGWSDPANNMIQSFDADGFTVGNNNEVNGSNGDTYHFIAWARGTGAAETGSYPGNGSAQSISGVGFQPELVMVKRTTSLGGAVFHSVTAELDTTSYIGPDPPFTGGIGNPTADGFLLGGDPNVNAALSNYHWVAFRDAAAPPQSDIAVTVLVDDPAPFAGDQITFSITADNLGPDDASSLQITDLLPAGLTYVTHALTAGAYSSATGAWDIGALVNGGTAGLSITADVDPGTEGWAIINGVKMTGLDQTDPDLTNITDSVTVNVQIKPFRMKSGQYTGDGALTRVIGGLGFQPEMVIIRGSGLTSAIVRTPTMPAGMSKELGDNKVLIPSAILSLDSLGFTTGADPAVNASGVEYYWSAFSAGTNALATGRYTGDGIDDRSITGVGFQPAYLLVLGEAAEEPMQRFGTQAGDASFQLVAGDAKSDRIQALELDGFQVGKHSSVNKSGGEYHFVAISDSTSTITHGMYLGSGGDNRAITGIGFTPDHLFLRRGNNGSDTSVRFQRQVGDSTFFVTPKAFYANGVQATLPDGFEVGTTDPVNRSAVLYHWLAFDDAVGALPQADIAVTLSVDDTTPNPGGQINIAVSVTNNGPNDASGLQITNLLPLGLNYATHVISGGTYNPITGAWDIGILAGGNSVGLDITADVDPGAGGWAIVDSALVTGLDQSDPDLSNNADSLTINVQGGTYHMTTGTYQGDGAPGRSIAGIGFQPDLVIVRGDTVTSTVARTSTMPPGMSKPLGDNIALMANAIASLDSGGFTVMGDVTVNAPGVTYYWIAFQADGSTMSVGSYTGNTSDDRSITGVGFQPGYMFVVNETSQEAVQRFAAQAGDATVPFSLGIVKPDRIQAFEPDGFQIGGNVTVNEAGRVHHYVAFRAAGSRASAGFYIGDLADNRSIGGAGFTPSYTLIRIGGNGTPGVQYFADAESDLTFPFAIAAGFSNSIQSVTSDGFIVGSDPTVNAMDDIYYWTAFKSDSLILPLEVGLHVTTAFDTAMAVEGDTVAATVWITNNGPRDATGVSVLDSLPAALQFVSATPAVGLYDDVSGIWDVGGIAVGDTIRLDLSALVLPGTAGTPVINSAGVLTTDLPDLEPSNDEGSDTLAVVYVVSLLDAAGSLYPATTFAGSPSLALRIDVNNPSPTGVMLDTTSTIEFTDGTNTYVANLTNRTHVLSGVMDFALAFDAGAVPAAITANAFYDLTLSLRGMTDESATYAETISTSGRNSIYVDQPMVQLGATVMGDQSVLPGARDVPVLAVEVANGYTAARTLDSLVVTNTSFGLGTQGQLDATFDRILLVADMDTSRTRSAGDLVLDTTVFSGGTGAFAGSGWQVPATGIAYLLVCADIDSTVARDGDGLDAAIVWSSDVMFVEPTVVDPSITPLTPVNAFGVTWVNGMAAHQIGFSSLSDTLYSGEANRLVATIMVPGNGYRPDTLSAMELRDDSGGFSPSDFSAVRLFGDDGDGLFDPATDTSLGDLVYSGDRYDISGLAFATGRLLFVAVDVALSPGNGNTFRPGIPIDALTVRSDNDGPIDVATTSAGTHTIVAVEKVDVTTNAIASTTTRPGARDVPLISLTLHNNTLAPITLDSISVQNATAGPGTQAELDAVASTVRVYQDGGNGVVDFGDVELSGASAFSGGLVVLPVGLSLTPGQPYHLLVTCDVSLTCAADGDTINARIASTSDLIFDVAAQVQGLFPLLSGNGRHIDGMLDDQVSVFPAADSLIITSAVDNLVFEFDIPGNGYQADSLVGLSLQNLGTATTEHISRLVLYRDGGDLTFDAGAGDDTLLGEFVSTGMSNYDLSVAPEPLPAECGVDARLYVAADLNLAATTGATIQLQIPTMGIVVASNNDGPINGPIVNPSLQLIPRPDELTVFPYSVGDKRVYANQKNVLNFGIGFYNGFDAPVTLTSVELFQDGSATVGEVPRIRAYADADTNGLFSRDNDLFLAQATSADGRYLIEGFTLALAEKQITYLFVTYDLAGVVRDSVGIDLQLNTASDLSFTSKSVTVKGEFPGLNSPGIDITDGMIAAQIPVTAAPDMRVAPGDPTVFALGFTLPSNGFFSDTFNALTISNGGSALPGQDINVLNLWVEDSGDNEFEPSQDRQLSTLNWSGGGWRSPPGPPLGETITTAGLTCYVTASVSATANDGRTIQLFIPMNGIEVESANDGPIDTEVANPQVQTISTDPLLTSIARDRSAYSVGQTITVTMTARNVGPTPLTGVHPGIVTTTGTGSVVLATGPTPATATIPSNGDTTFVWTYTAALVGDIGFCGNAFDEDSTAVSISSCTQSAAIENVPANVTLALSDMTPPGANRGQGNVAAFRASIAYSGADTTAATAHINGVSLSILNAAGAPVPPNTFLASMTVISTTGSNFPFSLVDSTSNPLALTFASPIPISPGQAVELEVAMGIAPGAALQPMRVGVVSASDIRATDANSGGSVPLTSGEAYPWQTGPINIASPAESLLVATADTASVTINVAQENLVMFSGSMRNEGVPTTSNEILTHLSIDFFDNAGAPVSPGDVIRKLSIHSGTSTLYLTETIPGGATRMDCDLTTFLLLPAQTTLPIEIRVDARSFPTASGFRAMLTSPLDIEARDNNSNAPVSVGTLDPGATFPLPSRTLIFQQPATGMSVTSTSSAPDAILPGTANVSMMQLVFTHADTAASSVSLDSLVIEFRKPSGGAVYPGDYFSRLLIFHGTDVVAAVTSLSSIVPFVECRLLPGIALLPGTSDSLTVVLDAKTTFSPVEFFARVDKDYIYAMDVNDGSRILGINGTFPLMSDATWMRLTGDAVFSGLVSRLPMNVTGHEQQLPAFDLVIDNRNAPGFTSATLLGMTIDVQNWKSSPLSPGTITSAAYLMRADTLVTMGTVGTSTITFAVTPGVVEVAADERDTLSVLLDLDANVSNETFQLVLPDTASIQLEDAASGTPIAGGTITGTYPLTSGFAHILGADISTGFTNYPNPFAAGRGTTTITYFLESPGRVTLQLYTLWGADVATLLNNEPRSPGLHEETWDGLNENGDVVNNGVYYLVLEINPDGGGTHSLRRKVGVVR